MFRPLRDASKNCGSERLICQGRKNDMSFANEKQPNTIKILIAKVTFWSWASVI